MTSFKHGSINPNDRNRMFSPQYPTWSLHIPSCLRVLENIRSYSCLWPMKHFSAKHETLPSWDGGAIVLCGGLRGKFGKKTWRDSLTPSTAMDLQDGRTASLRTLQSSTIDHNRLSWYSTLLGHRPGSIARLRSPPFITRSWQPLCQIMIKHNSSVEKRSNGQDIPETWASERFLRTSFYLRGPGRPTIYAAKQ